jgi:hypothetical protein
MSEWQKQAFMAVWMLFFLFISTSAVYQHANDSLGPIWVCGFFLGAGAIWWHFNRTLPKWFIALVEIAAGSASNYHQLTVMIKNQGQYGYYDRLTFIFAGIAVIAKGLQDLADSPQKPWMKKLPTDKQPSPQPIESSAAPPL